MPNQLTAEGLSKDRLRALIDALGRTSNTSQQAVG
jgi:hypothetical protein